MSQPTWKISTSATLGTVLEWAEYTFYAYMAVDIARLFFPQTDSAVGLLAAFGVFAAGYLMRPVGALIFGYLGDKVGRKTALLGAMLLMALSTLGIGLLPTYAMIGVWAPIALLLLRCLQGLSVASELNGASIFLIEHAPKSPNLAGSLISSAAAVGMLCGGLAATITSLPSMPEFAWRFPFLLSFVVSLLTLYLRRILPETPTFLQMKAQQQLARFPLVELFLYYKKFFLLAFLIAAFINIYIYICNLYFTTHLIEYAHFDNTQAKLLATLGQTMVALFLPIFGWLADKYGLAKKIMCAGLLSAMITAPLLFWLAHFGTFWPVFLGQVCYALSDAMICAPVLKFLFDLFPANIRCSGNALAWSLSAAIFGGTAPLLSQYMTHQLHLTYGPALYVALSALIVYSTLVLLPRLRMFDAWHAKRSTINYGTHMSS